jgi:hypothetical protein
MVSYKDKVVCFIDILGFREMVNVKYAEQPEWIYSVLSKINTSIRDWSGTAITSNIDLRITQFSDSIVFSFLPTSHYFIKTLVLVSQSLLCFSSILGLFFMISVILSCP